MRPRMKELLFFIPFRFQHWSHKKQHQPKEGRHVRVREAREEMYFDRQDYKVQELKLHPSSISFEATPDYLMYSTFSMQAILCTLPWVKILITIRNPIDRLFSHYNFLKDPTKSFNLNQNRTFPSFEEFVQEQVNILRHAGVLPPLNANEDDVNSFYGSPQERAAWSRYQVPRNQGDRPLARSLYALQLEEWVEALEALGRGGQTLQQDILIVHQEEMNNNPHIVVNRVLDWLGLPNNENMTQLFKTAQHKMVTQYTTKTMKNSTRKFLQKLFHPYNQRLYKLLSWEPIWDE